MGTGPDDFEDEVDDLSWAGRIEAFTGRLPVVDEDSIVLSDN
jgi:hypothetical protein